jgi:hypothetical protein
MEKKRNRWITLFSGGTSFLDKRLPAPDEIRRESRQMEKAYTG